jgi:calcium-dependent protein kinase
MGNSCCISKKNKIIVAEKIIIKSRINHTKIISMSRRSSVYFPNNEQILTKYNFNEVLGAGYFGTVKLVSPKNDPNKKYACKSINKTKLSETKINNLIREIETLSMVDHPNIVKYYETYNDEKFFHIIMEYCTGGELFEKVIKKTLFDEESVRSILFKISSAIHHCHSIDIVHRDLKPENILFENNSEFSDIKIIDFGLSRKIFSGDDLKSIVGSPFYVAPEVLKGRYDNKCDIWSIGVLAYSLLSGKPPFFSENRTELFHKIENEIVSFTDKIWCGISSAAIDFIKSCLIKQPKKRLNSKKIISHKWFKSIQEGLSIKSLDPEILTSMKNFHAPRQFTKTILKFIVKQFKNKDIEDLNKAFNILDKEKTGFISFAQLKSAFDYCKVDIKSDELKAIIENYSHKKKEGKINYSNFIASVVDKKKLISKDLLWETFKNFDVNNSNKVSLENIIKVFERTGKKVKKEDLEKMFEEENLQIEQGFGFDEFCKILENDI